MEFAEKVRNATLKYRVIVLSFPEFMCVNPNKTIENALTNAGFNDPVILHIQDGMNISAEVGTHFSASTMPADSLAHFVCGRPQAVVLHAKGTKAQESCNHYAAAFLDALDKSAGNVRLIIALRSGDYQADQAKGDLKVIAFDGWINPSEMQAYVYQRMVSYDGPGSTNLYKHLVAEYASFDPSLAERLSQMEPSTLLNLPDCLSQIVSEDALRWSKDGWVHGTTCNSSKEAHSLREWYLVTHSPRHADMNRRLLEKRFWRACVKSLTPWLEERRLLMIEVLKKPIDRIEANSGEKNKIQKKIGDKYMMVSRDELEFNDLVFRSYGDDFRGSGLSEKERAAVSICHMAKKVRDDLSHLRKPDLDCVNNLISSMDQLLPAT
jgi:hypothetical protein